MIDRRRLLLTALATAIAQDRSLAQIRQPRIAIVFAERVPAYLSAFVDSLASLGWQETVSVAIKVSDARGDPQLLPIVIEEMRAWSPDVLVSSSNRTHIALSSVIRDVPIVVVAAIDPIRIGLSDSLAYPSRNFTGSVGFIEGLMHKRMEVLKAAMPGARKVALHLDPNNPAFPPTHDDTVQAAGRLGIEVVVAGYSHRNEVVPALDAAKRQGADAVIVLPDGIAISQMGAIAQRSTELGLPTIGFNDTELSLGLTFIVGADRTQLWRDAAATTSKILRGTPINKIPFQQPTKIYIGVNLRSAKKFGLDIPLSLLARADDVLE